ncbi:polynucleotide 5'-hydroxyl-kinase NOL9-like isoform X1 [Gastrolobium bilobum]|uniref:polynucleotide 5'-hydroxyl-kinase NOL9-like isoform X1 n=1 Tax=Gastrolobium bilobum TaxID=150636 RepID=UPI002AB1D923|nr:polynucleotide 5'-hydroxyl-kinase NOL9-like isoform X1 [Gastrolobium bilobum]
MGSSPSPDIYIPKQWSEAADAILYSSMPPIAFICGAKNCGKTTFSRHLLNVLLPTYKKVAYFDTDVGQPEFTPPGCLSLTVVDKVTPGRAIVMNPYHNFYIKKIILYLFQSYLCFFLSSFFVTILDLTIPCLKTPERCLFFGDVSSKRDPSAYLNYVFAIYDYYRKKYCTLDKGENPIRIELPLIVNTPGWVKGVGYDVLVDMLKYIRPTNVVKISISTESKNLPAGEFWLDGEHEGTVNLIEINSARQDSLNRSVLVQKDACLLRDLRIMAYFRQCFSSDSNISTIKELAHSLASHCPYEVPITSIKIQHLHCEVPSSEIFYSLNASIVGLAVDSEGPGNLPWCLGLGIVRGIDTVKRVLYVITPVPHSSLEKVNLLLQGYIQIPTCLLQVQGCVSPYISANALT